MERIRDKVWLQKVAESLWKWDTEKRILCGQDVLRLDLGKWILFNLFR